MCAWGLSTSVNVNKMDHMEGYESDSFSSVASQSAENSDYIELADVEGELDARSVRKVYLITYSQADLTAFPTRKSFSDAVVASFNGSPATIVQWSCCREKHEQTSGYHYHMALKFDRNQRWLASKRFLQEEHGISVHFSSVHQNYYSAWQYVVKYDDEILHSEPHPDLWNTSTPRTAQASLANTARGKRVRENAAHEKEQKSKGTSKKKRMSAFELSQIIIEKGIKMRTELLALGNDKKNEGKTDIAEFVVNRGSKAVAEVLETAWEMETASSRLLRSRKSRLDILSDCNDGQCVSGCNGEWLRCAEEILQQNGVRTGHFQESVLQLLEKGRGKYRNVMIVGPANCGKTFLLDPLNAMYETFSNPASTSFAWVGAEKAECIFLNDFRWSPAVIQWNDFLLLLEGQLVHLPAPKTHYAKDIVFNRDTPIFATSKHPIMFVKNAAVDERETEMMAVRWKVFHFSVQIAKEKQKEIPPCPKCFANLILCTAND